MTVRWGFNDLWWPNLADALPDLRKRGADAIRFPNSTDTDEAHNNLWGILQLVEPDIQPFPGGWGWGGGPGGPPPPIAYANYYRNLAGTYGNRCHWVLWNEPNLNHPEGGAQRCLTVEETIALCRPAAEAIHEVAPDARILGPPLSPTKDSEEFQREVYRGLPDYCHVAINVYPRAKLADDRLAEVAAQYDAASKHGQVHVTEIDMAFPEIHQDSTAPNLAAKAFKMLAKRGARTIIFNSLANHRRELDAITKAAREVND